MSSKQRSCGKPGERQGSQKQGGGQNVRQEIPEYGEKSQSQKPEMGRENCR